MKTSIGVIALFFVTTYVGAQDTPTSKIRIGMYANAGTSSLVQGMGMNMNMYDGLKGNSSPPHRIRYYDKELFIRMQAIDATRNELIWSVKIYPNEKKGLAAESIPRVVHDLTRSFERVQFNIDKINQP